MTHPHATGPIPLLTGGHLVGATLATGSVTSAVFDDPSLVAAMNLARVAQTASLSELAVGRLTAPTNKGANAEVKITSLVAGMTNGADSISDLAVLRQVGMGRAFTYEYAPSTPGPFLPAFTFRHVRHADAGAARLPLTLAGLDPPGGGLVSGKAADCEASGSAQRPAPFAFLGVDDTIIEVHGHHIRGAGVGYFASAAGTP